MKCTECGCLTNQDPEDTGGICWPCNDKKILDSWYKPTPVIEETNLNTAEFEEYKQNQSKYIQASAALDKLNAIKTTTLPTDSTERKNYPLFRGLLRYFPAALAGVSNTSQRGNDKHNPGQELHHARGKSTDHGDCILRHLMDLTDLLTARDRGAEVSDEQILEEVNSMAWRSLALSQELHESLGKAPLAPGAKE